MGRKKRTRHLYGKYSYTQRKYASQVLDSINNTIKNSDLRRINRSRIKPTAYDILSCLQKYDVGDIEDFICEFGYEIKKRGDLTRIQNIYNAVVKEYQDICRCFTPEQIEAMQEIQ